MQWGRLSPTCSPCLSLARAFVQEKYDAAQRHFCRKSFCEQMMVCSIFWMNLFELLENLSPLARSKLMNTSLEAHRKAYDRSSHVSATVEILGAQHEALQINPPKEGTLLTDSFTLPTCSAGEIPLAWQNRWRSI